MDMDTLKRMACRGLIGRHIAELQSTDDLDALAAFALAFRDDLSEVISYDPQAPTPRSGDLMGIKMS
jgi:hypothetical protein